MKAKIIHMNSNKQGAFGCLFLRSLDSWNATRKAKQKRTLQLLRRERKACVSSKDYLGKLAGSAALDLGALSQSENSMDLAVGRIWAGQRLTTGVYRDKEYMEMEWELGGELNK